MSYFDRQKVIGTLKAALGQGRLTQEEYDERADQASASQTHDELAALTADLPPGLNAARPPTVKDARAGVLVVMVAASVLGLIVWWSPDNMLAFLAGLAAIFTVLVASPITVGLMLDARHQKRLRGQLPPRPEPPIPAAYR